MEEFGSAERIEFRLVRLNSSIAVVIRWFVLYNIQNRPRNGHHHCLCAVEYFLAVSVSGNDSVLVPGETVVEVCGGEAEVMGDYPAWEYKAESKLREEIAVAFKNVYGKEVKFDAIHAGLECGILSEKIEGLDCVSFGPQNFDIHTPQERLNIESTERVWNFLVEFLKQAK